MSMRARSEISGITTFLDLVGRAWELVVALCRLPLFTDSLQLSHIRGRLHLVLHHHELVHRFLLLEGARGALLTVLHPAVVHLVKFHVALLRRVVPDHRPLLVHLLAVLRRLPDSGLALIYNKNKNIPGTEESGRTELWRLEEVLVHVRGLALLLDFLGRLLRFLGFDASHVLGELQRHRLQFSFLVLELGHLPRLPAVVAVLNPIVPVVEIVPGDHKQFPENLLQILVIRRLGEAQPPDVRQVSDELLWEALAELFERDF